MHLKSVFVQKESKIYETRYNCMHTSYQNFAVVKKEICFNDIHGNEGKEKFNLIFISVLFSLLLM